MLMRKEQECILHKETSEVLGIRTKYTKRKGMAKWNDDTAKVLAKAVMFMMYIFTQ
jgi:hypothetical protein